MESTLNETFLAYFAFNQFAVRSNLLQKCIGIGMVRAIEAFRAPFPIRTKFIDNKFAFS